MPVRHMTADTLEKNFRKILRHYGIGWKVEAVSWVRRQGDEHTCVVCWPGDTAASVIERVTLNHMSVEVARIHLGEPNKNYTNPEDHRVVRVYFRWTTRAEFNVDNLKPRGVVLQEGQKSTFTIV